MLDIAKALEFLDIKANECTNYTINDLEKIYKRKVRELHPDMNIGQPIHIIKQKEEKLKKLNVAMEYIRLNFENFKINYINKQKEEKKHKEEEELKRKKEEEERKKREKEKQEEENRKRKRQQMKEYCYKEFYDEIYKEVIIKEKVYEKNLKIKELNEHINVLNKKIEDLNIYSEFAARRIKENNDVEKEFNLFKSKIKSKVILIGSVFVLFFVTTIISNINLNSELEKTKRELNNFNLNQTKELDTLTTKIIDLQFELENSKKNLINKSYELEELYKKIKLLESENNNLRNVNKKISNLTNKKEEKFKITRKLFSSDVKYKIFLELNSIFNSEDKEQGFTFSNIQDKFNNKLLKYMEENFEESRFVYFKEMYNWSEEELTFYYTKLMRSLPKNEKKKLKKEEIEWIKYKENLFKNFENNLKIKYNLNQAIVIEKIYCFKLDITLARLSILTKYFDELEEKNRTIKIEK